MQHYIYTQNYHTFSLVSSVANHSITIFFGIVQFGIMAVLQNLVSICFNAWDLVRPPTSGVRVGDVRSRVWRIERHPLHVVPEPARPSAAQWLSDIIYHHRFAVMHLCVSVRRTIIPETRPLLTHTDVCPLVWQNQIAATNVATGCVMMLRGNEPTEFND